MNEGCSIPTTNLLMGIIYCLVVSLLFLICANNGPFQHAKIVIAFFVTSYSEIQG